MMVTGSIHQEDLMITTPKLELMDEFSKIDEYKIVLKSALFP